MPKKTKQQKIVTQLRRLQEAHEPSTAKQPSQPVVLDLKSTSPTPEVSSGSLGNDYHYVMKDLRKTAIFALLAVVLLVVLSLTASNLYATLISRLI